MTGRDAADAALSGLNDLQASVVVAAWNVHRILSDAKNPRRASDAARYAERQFSRDADGNPDLRACEAGCNHCCRFFVPATAPEILLLARFAAARKGQHPAFSAARIAEAGKQNAGLAGLDRILKGVACPLLAPEGCAAHADRPIACRYLISPSKKLCEGIAAGQNANIPIPRERTVLRSLATLSLKAATAMSGLPHASYELSGGLAAAATAGLHNAEGAWLSGKDLFRGVTRDPGADQADEVLPDIVRRAKVLSGTARGRRD